MFGELQNPLATITSLSEFSLRFKCSRLLKKVKEVISKSHMSDAYVTKFNKLFSLPSLSLSTSKFFPKIQNTETLISSEQEGIFR